MIGVTGASGFIGAHLLAQLGDSGFSIDLRTLDTPDRLVDYLRKHDCNAIVHLAWLAAWGCSGAGSGLVRRRPLMLNLVKLQTRGIWCHRFLESDLKGG